MGAYGMVLAAENTTASSLFAVEFLAGHPIAPVAANVTVNGSASNAHFGASVSVDVQLSTPPATFDFSFIVIPTNGNIAGNLLAVPPVMAAVTLTLYGWIGELGSVTLTGGDSKITFLFSAPEQNAFEDGGKSFIESRTKPRSLPS